MNYITKKINRIDDLIRHNPGIDQTKKDEILQTLQLIHAQARLMMEVIQDVKNNNK